MAGVRAPWPAMRKLTGEGKEGEEESMGWVAAAYGGG
jgi:hypothetical protein